MAAALIPALLLGLLTYHSVTVALQKQQQKDLVEASRSYALSLMSRLQAARSFALVLANYTAENATLFASRFPMFDLAQHTSSEKAAQLRAVDALPSSIGLGQLSTAPVVAIVIEPPAGPGVPPRIFLIVSRQKHQGTLRLRIRPSYLFAAADEIDAAHSLCVWTEAFGRLFCSDPTGVELPPITAGEGRSITAGSDASISAVAGKSAAEVGSYLLFLKPEFSTAAWTVVSQRRFIATGGAFANFFPVYLTVMASAVLLVALLSLVQIRRTLGPLHQLMAGARRIAAGDFADIVVHSTDEFGELAGAVNEMSSQIEHQLATLKSMALIDHELLERLRFVQVTTLVADRVHQLVPAAVLCVVRQIVERSGFAMIYTQATPGSAMQEREAMLSDMTRPCHKACDNELPLPGIGNGYLALLSKAAPDHSTWQSSLTCDGEACGAVSVSWGSPINPTAAIISEFEELTNRLALAIQLEERELRLQHLARHDSLTGLPNRRALEEKTAALMGASAPAGVLFVDLDRFKQINDNFGHMVGDQVLVIVADRLSDAIGNGMVGRLAGDEFVVILEYGDIKSVTDMATRLLGTLTDPIAVGLQRFRLSCSIGIALHPGPRPENLSVLERADIAMYRAKQDGRNRYALYSDSMMAESQRRQTLEADLRLAITEEQFFLQYQPKVNLRTGKVEGAEALIRWDHPKKGLIPPVEFIGMVEDLGLIVPLGHWVLRTACVQNATWRAAGLKSVRIAVNVSARQFAESGFVESVATILSESGLSSDGLEIELTETVMMTDAEQMKGVLNGLRRLGITLALDDFGTGYSSLSYLKNFPVDVLKIDRSFINGLDTDDDDRLLVTAIIGIAHNLKMNVVAEGVETLEQLTYLRSQFCDEIQGFYFSQPLAAEGFAEMLIGGKQL